MSAFATSFTVDGRRVGAGAPCWVVAEAGSNHDGDLGKARELVDAAAEAGADAVKFQVFSADDLYSARTPRFEYLRGVVDLETRDVLRAAELPRWWLPHLASHARDRGITFLATPFDDAAVEQLVDVGVPALKVANYELVDVHLVQRVAEQGLPVLLSVGMATYGEVEDALAAVERGGGAEVALMRCAARYPAPPGIMNLRAMGAMRAAFGVPVGLSDHSAGLAVPLGAAGAGMELLEKHFTLDRGAAGPDHAFAVEPDELTALVTGVRDVEAAMGDGRLSGPAPEELEMHRLARRSVVAARDIAAGSVVERADLTVKRPGWGVAPKHLDLLVGRRARVDVAADDVVTWDAV